MVTYTTSRYCNEPVTPIADIAASCKCTAHVRTIGGFPLTV